MRGLMFLFGTKKRAWWTVTCLIAVIIAVALGVKIGNNRLDFRAFEDPPTKTDPTGFDYVEYVTQDLFDQELAKVPADQLPDYDKIAIVADLSNQNYFRLNLATERQTFLSNWQPEVASWKTFAQNAEAAAGGAWPWLEWLKPYCKQGGGRTGLNIIDHAQAQSFNPDECTGLEKLVIDALLYKARTPAELDFLKTFDTEWRGFRDRAIAKCFQRTPSYQACIPTAIYSKSDWEPADLDKLYNQRWKDLKSRRTKIGFGSIEIKRITTTERYVRLMQKKADDQLSAKEASELTHLAGDVALMFLPVERPIAAAVKLGGKAVGFVAKNVSKAPIGSTAMSAEYAIIKATFQIAKASDKITTAVRGILVGVEVNVSKIFARSRLNTRSPLVEQFITRWLNGLGAFGADKEVLAALHMDESKMKAAITNRIIPNTRVVRGKEMKKLAGCNTRDFACYLNDKDFLYNEEMLVLAQKKGMTGIEQSVIHETNHHFSVWLVLEDGKYYRQFKSNTLHYNPIEEGAAESTAHYIASKSNLPVVTTSYPNEKIWFDEVVNAIDRGQRLGKIPATQSARQLAMEYYYSRGLHWLDTILNPGVPSGSGISSFLGTSFSYFDNSQPQQAISLARSLFK